MQEAHPFSKFIAILARGKTKTRSFTLEESVESMGMILRGEVFPEQVGAFLMLMRLKEETPAEIAGFAMGARSTMELPDTIPAVDIDWSSYAGKRRQLPWFVLSALVAWPKMDLKFSCMAPKAIRRVGFTRASVLRPWDFRFLQALKMPQAKLPKAILPMCHWKISFHV